MPAGPSIEAAPERALLDERVTVRLRAFPPNRRITVRSRQHLDGAIWEARAQVRTDADGRADLDEQAPLAGTYRTADAMGLVWSAERVGTRPATDNRPKTAGNLSLSATHRGRTLATATVERQFAADGVERRSVADTDLVGELYEPPGEGPHPGVLLLGGSGGGFPSRRAASLLASRGFAVLALAYFGLDDLPDRLVRIPLSYVETAVAWLAACDAVRESPLGVVGWSRGGELALLLATRCDRVRTVVAYVPSTVVFQGNSRKSSSAWSTDGSELPFVPLSISAGFVARSTARWLGGQPVAVRPLFERGLARASDAVLADATIPVEDIGGPLLFVTGTDDRVWPADDLVTRALARLDARGYEQLYQHLRLPAAGHDVKVPFHPTTERSTGVLPVRGRPLVLDMGGTPTGYAQGDARAWRHTLDTLREGLLED